MLVFGAEDTTDEGEGGGEGRGDRCWAGSTRTWGRRKTRGEHRRKNGGHDFGILWGNSDERHRVMAVGE